MTQIYTVGAYAEAYTIGERIQKIELRDGFATTQFVNYKTRTLHEEKVIKTEWGIQKSTVNPIGVDLVSVTQTISEEFVGPRLIAAQSAMAPINLSTSTLKRILKADGIIFTRAVLTTAITARTDALRNTSGVTYPSDFQWSGTPQYITSDWTFRPASVVGGGTSTAWIKLHKSSSGYTLGALLDNIDQTSSIRDVQTTTWNFTTHWVDETVQASQPNYHIFDPNTSDALNSNMSFYSPTVGAFDNTALIQGTHIWTWTYNMSLSEDGFPTCTLDIEVHPIDNTLD